MFQLSRQILRITALTIGFILFVVVSIHSASQATNREAVVGKPSLFNINQLGASSTLTATNLTRQGAMAPSAVKAPAAIASRVANTQESASSPPTGSPVAQPPTAAQQHAATSLPSPGRLPATAAPQAVAATGKHQLP